MDSRRIDSRVDFWTRAARAVGVVVEIDAGEIDVASAGRFGLSELVSAKGDVER